MKSREGIYIIYNNVNGKKYIGKSLNVKERVNQHINSLTKCTHANKKLQKDFNKYSIENFKFDVIKYTKNYLETYYYESYYAELYNVYENGYNIGKLSASEDIKYMIKNKNEINNKMLRICKDITNSIKSDSWIKLGSYNKLAEYLNITDKQSKILPIVFDDQKGEYSISRVDRNYFQISYLNTAYELGI